jgi:hypothetical protein
MTGRAGVFFGLRFVTGAVLLVGDEVATEGVPSDAIKRLNGSPSF